MERMGDERNTDRNQKPRKGKEKGSEEERKFDGMTDCALREIWKD